MFLLFLLLLSILCNLVSVLRFWALYKVYSLSEPEKYRLLSSLTAPAGFTYRKRKDLFTSTLHPWQRKFGYHSGYDLAAVLGQMVFDCEPVYFDYDQRTWRIELWKGQYGICTGAEAGVYHADTLLTPAEYDTALFHSISDEELPLIDLELWKKDRLIFRIARPHWWLTGFRMGMFSQPECLTLKATFTFSDSAMASSFFLALQKLGYCRDNAALHIQNCGGAAVNLSFTRPRSKQPCARRPLRCAIAQYLNRFLVFLYDKVTRPLSTTTDKVLYLSFFLPFVFRRLIRIRKPLPRGFRYRARYPKAGSFRQTKPGDKKEGGSI